MDSRDYDSDRLVFFIDVREPAEIQKLKDVYNAQAILIQRDSNKKIEQVNTADNESNFDPELYDMVISNNGTLEQLEAQARTFMKPYKYNK